ncbi:MAG: hypothetical protein D8B55_04335 [Actinomyces sp.]|nr:MAG: hypothetical protein D8B55_04335 [Actinomyces sp.]
MFSWDRRVGRWHTAQAGGCGCRRVAPRWLPTCSPVATGPSYRAPRGGSTGPAGRPGPAAAAPRAAPPPPPHPAAAPPSPAFRRAQAPPVSPSTYHPRMVTW